MHGIITEALGKLFEGESVSREMARRLLNAPLPDLLYGANRLREEFCGNSVSLCAVVNAKSGLCTEDCTFCAQSSRYDTGAPVHPLRPEDEIVDGARSAVRMRAERCGIVTSGNGPRGEELDTVCDTVRAIGGLGGVTACASLGQIDAGMAGKLKRAGLIRYHHNLECSRGFFPSVCTTHSWEERLRTVRVAKEAGLEVCSGGIFGIGEEWEDRIDLACTLRELGVDSVPLNFLVPMRGTPLGSREPVSAGEALKIIAVFRYILPGGELRIAGGREFVLGELQSWIFFAGASGMMVGDYLTTKGREIDDDLRMIAQLGLKVT
jgi:biotin synthase